MVHGSITQEQTEFVETWENVSTSVNFIIRLNARGEEVHEAVEGPREFKVRTIERIITQDKVVDPKNDPFLNGSFRPVIVPEDITLESNPNALSDDEILRIFEASDLAWDEYMGIIDAPATLRRMVDLAENSDIRMPRYKRLKQRLEEVTGGPKHATQKDEEQYRKLAS